MRTVCAKLTRSSRIANVAAVALLTAEEPPSTRQVGDFVDVPVCISAHDPRRGIMIPSLPRSKLNPIACAQLEGRLTSCGIPSSIASLLLKNYWLYCARAHAPKDRCALPESASQDLIDLGLSVIAADNRLSQTCDASAVLCRFGRCVTSNLLYDVHVIPLPDGKRLLRLNYLHATVGGVKKADSPSFSLFVDKRLRKAYKRLETATDSQTVKFLAALCARASSLIDAPTHRLREWHEMCMALTNEKSFACAAARNPILELITTVYSAKKMLIAASNPALRTAFSWDHTRHLLKLLRLVISIPEAVPLIDSLESTINECLDRVLLEKHGDAHPFFTHRALPPRQSDKYSYPTSKWLKERFEEIEDLCKNLCKDSFEKEVLRQAAATAQEASSNVGDVGSTLSLTPFEERELLMFMLSDQISQELPAGLPVQIPGEDASQQCPHLANFDTFMNLIAMSAQHRRDLLSVFNEHLGRVIRLDDHSTNVSQDKYAVHNSSAHASRSPLLEAPRGHRRKSRPPSPVARVLAFMGAPSAALMVPSAAEPLGLPGTEFMDLPAAEALLQEMRTGLMEGLDDPETHMSQSVAKTVSTNHVHLTLRSKDDYYQLIVRDQRKSGGLLHVIAFDLDSQVCYNSATGTLELLDSSYSLETVIANVSNLALLKGSQATFDDWYDALHNIGGVPLPYPAKDVLAAQKPELASAANCADDYRPLKMVEDEQIPGVACFEED